MILNVNATCDLLTVTSENGYIADIVTADGTKCCHVLELGTNCCTPTTLLPIRSLYSFSYGLVSCGVATVVTPSDGWELVLEITGLDYNCIESITYPDTNSVGTVTTTNPTSNQISYKFNQVAIGGDIPFNVLITTCTGLTYTLDFTITVGDIGDVCNTLTYGLITITNPALPTGVTINGSNQFEIDPTALGMTTVFSDGVYFVGLSQTDTAGNVTAESNTTFIDCSTTCKVIDVLAKDTCSKIYLLLDALKYSNACTTISYQQKCDLWYVIAKELGYFTDNPCGDVEDCGCNK